MDGHYLNEFTLKKHAQHQHDGFHMTTIFQKVTMQPDTPVMTVTIIKGNTDAVGFRFDRLFRIGRGYNNDIRFTDNVVSRFHAEVRFENGKWRIYDLDSGNGTFIHGKQIKSADLEDTTRVVIGTDGPVLVLSVEKIMHAEFQEAVTGRDTDEAASLSLTHYRDYYFGDKKEADMGKHTLMVRRAFEQVRQKEKKKYTLIISIAVCLFLVAGGIAVFKHLQIRKHRLLAENIFYNMKSLELEFSDVFKLARTRHDEEIINSINVYQEKHRELEDAYDQFVSTLNVYRKSLSEEERLILRVARIFGECEINMPEDFVKEVLLYISKWRSTDRLSRALKTARRKQYAGTVADTMIRFDLPPQFFYLALQESNFNVNACGPRTKYGIAKGAWQFIPSTAGKYGLKVGPLAHLSMPDQQDERHDFQKATLAAAKYIRFIYDTDAQASGLLVMASYNWGEDKIIDLLQQMPGNPKERNFWRFLEKHRDKIPTQTYDYVFYIFSAAVIGENPDLFGFDFDNPLAMAMQ